MFKALLGVAICAACFVWRPEAVASDSKWIVERGHSTSDHSPAASLRLVPSLGKTGISVLCLQGRTKLTLVSLEQLPLPAHSDSIVVSYQIDGTAPRRRAFAVVRPDAFSIEGDSAQEMLSEMATGDRLAVQLESPAGVLDKSELPIAGLADAMKPLRDACRW